jgi:hypothetical protein
MQRVREDIKGIFDNSRRYKENVLSGLRLVGRDDSPGLPFEIHSVRPVLRVGPDKQLLTDALIEVTQKLPGYFDMTLDEVLSSNRGNSNILENEPKPDFWYRGGCTIIMDTNTGGIRYCIAKDINDRERYDRQRTFISGDQLDPSIRETFFGSGRLEFEEEIFSLLHRIEDRGESQ